MNKKTFDERNNDLMDRWYKLKNSDDNGFVWDGIINYDNWMHNDLKLAFFLKEAYTKNGEDKWDISEQYNNCDGRFIVGNNANQSMHNRLVEWAYAADSIMHGKSGVKREDAIKNDYENARNAMLKCAVLNIKKIAGNTSSKDNNLRTMALRDKVLLNEQIEIIKPNIIVFCSTFGNILKDILYTGAQKIAGTTRCYEMDGMLLIDFLHPSRVAKDSFEWLKEEISLIENKERFLK